ncbi:MAG: P63C domain-containing protein [Acidobacteria bacterium]|nr:P63C domain-containing protein [Acidobacteriota bacterium]
MTLKITSQAAKKLSELGAAKGGDARAAKLSAERRKEIARAAIEARWARSGKTPLPKATHSGPLKIGNLEFEAAVLQDGTRVISEAAFMKAMGMYRSGAVSVRRREEDDSTQIPLSLAHKNLRPFIDLHLGGVHFRPLAYVTTKGNVVTSGLSAAILPKICEVWIDAEKAGVLGERQKQVAAKAELLLRGMAHVGIIALVDEATGYQQERARDELNKILEAYISPELLPWTKRFPNEFFKQLYKLNKWNYVEGSHKRPRYVGKMVNNLVYQHLPPGVLPELKRLNPPNESGRRKHTHHQLLTPETGHPHLDRQIIEVTALMRVSDDKAMFKKLFEKAFPKHKKDENQLVLPGMEKE